ncbi:MAG: hypothetical protein R6W70_00695 [bacterium]
MSDKKFVYASILLFAGIFLIFLSLNHDVDSHGTKETFLVRTNGSVVCQSCIGLSDANFFYNFKKLFSGEKEDKN